MLRLNISKILRCNNTSLILIRDKYVIILSPIMVLGNKYFTLLHFILQDRVYSKKGSNEDGE